jgi:phosphoglycerate dehydrogenase-like enzyme
VTTVAVLDDDAGRAEALAPWETLVRDHGVAVTFHRRYGDPDALVQALKGVEIIVAMRERTAFPRSTLAALGNLRLLVTTGMANAAIDLDAAHDLGVTVSGTSSDGSGVIEIAWALILELTKQIGARDRAVRAGEWQRSLTGDLRGKTLGLIGLGRLGAGMVPVAKALQMNAIAWSANLTAARAEEVGVAHVGFDELLARSDIVSIHTRLSDRTRGLLDAHALEGMRPGALLINTSRGPIVDEVALVDALERRTIGGAGLDVFDEEPLPPNHPLGRLDNVCLTPHLGYATEANIGAMYREAIEDIAAFLDGQAIRAL